MILIQPDKLQFIRKNPIYKEPFIILERIDEQGKVVEELAEAPEGYEIQQAFSYFANEGLIKPKGWLELNLRSAQEISNLITEAQNTNKLYWGNKL